MSGPAVASRDRAGTGSRHVRVPVRPGFGSGRTGLPHDPSERRDM